MNTQTDPNNADNTSKKISPERAIVLKRNIEDPKKITLREAINRAINNYEQIFVMNASDRGGKKGRGHVFIQVDGATNGMLIPDTFIPIDVTSMFPAKKLAESPDFLQAIDNHLTIHDPDECVVFMQSKEAQAELERLRSAKDKFDNDISKNMAELQISVSPSGGKEDNGQIQFEEPVVAQSKYGPDRVPDENATNDRDATGVLWRVYQIINDPETSHDKILAPLRTTPNLNSVDLDYILKRVRDESVRKWARLKSEHMKK
jgi:hypothetical protein